MEFINRTGQFYEKPARSNKYNIELKELDIKKNVQRLTNQMWKLIPMRENEEDWLS